jgi:hypothetical protein
MSTATYTISNHSPPFFALLGGQLENCNHLSELTRLTWTAAQGKASFTGRDLQGHENPEVSRPQNKERQTLLHVYTGVICLVRGDILVGWFEPAAESFVTRSGWIRVR